MRLMLVRVRGYKRFSDRTSLDTRGPLIAIVGPNEAGKTSLLEALRHLSSPDPFDLSEFTDRQDPGSESWIVSGHFALEKEDLDALGDLDVKEGLQYEISRYSDGRQTWRLKPDLHRDLGPRMQAAKELRTALDRGWLGDVEVSGDILEEEATLHDLAHEVGSLLSGDREDIHQHGRDQLRTLKEVLGKSVGERDRKSLKRLPLTFEAALRAEDEEHPSYRAARILQRRLPRFLMFTDADRDLAAEYAWIEYEDSPRALANLLALAQVDFSLLRSAATSQDRTSVDTMLLAGNERLDEAFKAWRQGELFVSLSADNETLHILVRDRETKTHTRFDERSSGLRSFVALVCFTARYAGDVRPILLIDEAEMHLHYGAQADLVRVFERQRVADTVIYTTHSIGCLPEDLGATIRVVAPTGHLRSTIRNSFWAGTTGGGLTPMMLAMGAEALAFTPSRRAVIGEGPVEAILLPTLLKEALPPDQRDQPLGYQIAPGVAEIHPGRAADLELEAGGVAYLVDSDSGGRAHTRKLPSRAKSESRVVVLGEGKEPGLCTEDFVRAEVLTQAFNNVLSRQPDPPNGKLSPEELPSVSRPLLLNQWCKERGLEPLNKVQVAQEALSVAASASEGLLEPKRRRQLYSLHKRLLRATGPP